MTHVGREAKGVIIVKEEKRNFLINICVRTLINIKLFSN